MSIGVFLCFGLWLEIWQILEDVFAAPFLRPVLVVGLNDP